jgi:hypothetical protein
MAMPPRDDDVCKALAGGAGSRVRAVADVDTATADRMTVGLTIELT